MVHTAFSQDQQGSQNVPDTVDEHVLTIGADPPEMTIPAPRISRRETLDFQLKTTGLNKLIEAAMPVLGLSVRVRNMQQYESVMELHSRVSNEIQNFQKEIENIGYDEATVLAARYCLCSAIDEAVLSQQWGAESLWPEHPMLSIYHNETWGGEKFFAILDRVLGEAHRFSDLLEFLYICISLGFEGKYHVMHNGQTKLNQLRETIYEVIEKQFGEPAIKLLDPDKNIYDQKQKMSLRVPIWGIVLAGFLVLAGTHIYFDQTLSRAIENIARDIDRSLNKTPDK